MGTERTEPAEPLAKTLETMLAREFAKAVGVAADSRTGRALMPLFRPPVRRFARLLAEADARVASDGIVRAASGLTRRLSVAPRLLTPPPAADGPLLIVANHPGTDDSLLLIEAAGRDDILIVIATIPALLALPHASAHFLPVRRGQGHASTRLMGAADHLNAGGAVLLFPSGRLDPDPALEAGAADALSNWSSSVGLILRQAPATQVVTGIVSHNMGLGWLRLAALTRQPSAHARRRLAEFLHVSHLVVMHQRRRVPARVSFSPPLAARSLPLSVSPAAVRDALVVTARELLGRHRAAAGIARPAWSGTHGRA